MSHKRPCCEVERGDIMKKIWYLIIAIVLLVIVGGLAYGYHEHSKPKTAQELKPCGCVFTDYSCATRICYEGTGDSRWSSPCKSLLNTVPGRNFMDALNTGKVDAAAVLVELGVKAREQGIDDAQRH